MELEHYFDISRDTPDPAVVNRCNEAIHRFLEGGNYKDAANVASALNGYLYGYTYDAGSDRMVTYLWHCGGNA